MIGARLIGVRIGIALIAVALVADYIGLGPNPGMGIKQYGLAAVGAIVLVVSLVLGRKSKD